MNVAEQSNERPGGRPDGRPRAPVLPVFSFGSVFGGRRAAFQSVLDVATPLLVTSGRAALASALQECGVSSEHSVLVPAYACPSVMNPIKWCGARVIYYKVRENLEIDFDDVAAKAGAGTRAIVAIHYFGFPQELTRLRSFCDSRGIHLIEDCAHALFEANGRNVLGRVGDYAIGSLVKFYAIGDGGFLTSARRSLKTRLRGGGAKHEAKSLLNLLETSFSYARLRPLNWLLALPLRAKDWLWARLKGAGAARQSEPSADVPVPRDDYYFDPARLGVRASRISRVLMGLASARRLTELRRRNYRLLAQALEHAGGCRPLFPDLPDGVVPYMFPLLVDDPARVFPRLKHAGVPIFRWEEIETDVCEVSTAYSKRLLQIPCHQELRSSELQWLVDSIRAESAAN